MLFRFTLLLASCLLWACSSSQAQERSGVEQTLKDSGSQYADFQCLPNDTCVFFGEYFVTFIEAPEPAVVFKYSDECVLALATPDIQYDVIRSAWLYSDEPSKALRENAFVTGRLTGKAISRSDFSVPMDKYDDRNWGEYKGRKADMSICEDSSYIILADSFNTEIIQMGPPF